MARKCLFTALLDPEYAFEDVRETVVTNLGMLDIDGYRLKFLLEPEDEDATLAKIFSATYAVLKAFLSTLAWVTDIGVGYKPFDYVELIDDQLRSVPIRFQQPQARKVNNMALEATRQLLPRVLSDSTLRWALEDFRTALRETGHELVFLYRCIEWLQIRFGDESKFRKELGITKRQLRAITEPANNYYLTRHAQERGPQPVPPDVLKDAFKNTRKILQKYMNYLRSQSVNST